MKPENIDPGAIGAAASASAVTILASPFIQWYTLIFIVSIGGSLVSLSRADSPKGWEAIKYMFRAIVISLGLTLPCVYLLSPHTNLPVWLLILPIALFISVQGDKWLVLFDKAYDAIVASLLAIIAKKGGKDA